MFGFVCLCGLFIVFLVTYPDDDALKNPARLFHITEN